MHRQNPFSSLDIGAVNHDPTVKAPRTEQRRIQYVRAIGRGNENHSLVGLKTIHLDQELIESLLSLVESGSSMAPHRVDLIDEDNARGIFLPLDKKISHPGSSDADKHLHEVRAADAEERNPGLAGNGAGHEGLARTGGADQEASFGNPSTQSGKLFRIF